jgi:3-oxoacyl-(acyl-carrier-protein) synthase
VITGYGVVSHAGRGVAAFWEALTAAREAGLHWSPDDGAPFFVAPVPESYRPPATIPRNLVHFLDRPATIALDAALQAVEMAGLASHGDARRVGLADGLPYRAPGQPAVFVPYGHTVARALGVRGPVAVLAGAEASGLAAIVAAARTVASGEADVVIAGAAQGIQRPLAEHFAAQGWAADAPARPFDRDHAGAVPGEAAAYLVIEAEAHARGRGAVALARVAGHALAFDSAVEPLEFSSAPEIGRVEQLALAAAGYLQQQVDLVVSSGDGRQPVDFGEGYALRHTFGRHAHYVSLATVAGTVGATLAASGVLSAVAAVEALRRQQVFPIAGFATAEVDLDLAYVTATRPEKLEAAMVTAAGVGGTNAALLLARGDTSSLSA